MTVEGYTTSKTYGANGDVEKEEWKSTVLYIGAHLNGSSWDAH